MSFSTVLSAVTEGLAVELVHVEADIANGLPMFHMVGYLSSEVKEAGERVRTAIRNSGIDYPPKKTVINLSPATLRKRGASFDLPVATAVLISLGVIRQNRTKGCLMIGELGLDGKVRKVPGILPIVMKARQEGIKCVVVPSENVAEGKLVGGIQVIGAENLQRVITLFQGNEITWESDDRGNEEMASNFCEQESSEIDFSDIRGQKNVKRAAEIAAAGGHNLLLIGPPGSSKSMTARAMAGILPSLCMEESLEITKIYSVAGQLDETYPLIRRRPFREVHHTVTRAALIGGGTVPKPGEVSFAHGGILFLDELPEFRKGVLEGLRQPLESRRIHISRSYGTYMFPAGFSLVAAMNPCPCGCFPDLERCTCTPAQIQAYAGKISQPFLDRIDLCAEAERLEYGQLTGECPEESSAQIRSRVCLARRIQEERYRDSGIGCNAMLDTGNLKKWCGLGKEEKELMEQAYESLGLTARGYHRVIKTARTIADLDGAENIRKRHLQEAIGYRMIDRKYWGKRS